MAAAKKSSSSSSSSEKFTDITSALNEMGVEHEDRDEYEESQDAYGVASLINDISLGYVSRED